MRQLWLHSMDAMCCSGQHAHTSRPAFQHSIIYPAKHFYNSPSEWPPMGDNHETLEDEVSRRQKVADEGERFCVGKREVALPHLGVLPPTRHRSNARHCRKQDSPAHVDTIPSDIIGSRKCPSQWLSHRRSPNQCLRRWLVGNTTWASDNNVAESPAPFATPALRRACCCSPRLLDSLPGDTEISDRDETVLPRLSTNETLYVS